MVIRAAALVIGALLAAGCGRGPAGDDDFRTWLDQACDEVLVWSRNLPSPPQPGPTLGGLESEPVVRYADDLARGAEDLRSSLEAVGSSGDDAVDRLFDDLLAVLDDVASDAQAVADRYRDQPAVPVGEVLPLVGQAGAVAIDVGTAFGALARDPEVSKVAVDLASCEAAVATLS